MVSVLLQKPGADVPIKLAHALETAATPESATARVLREVEKTFPGYMVVNTLATQVDLKDLFCDAPASASRATVNTASRPRLWACRKVY